MSDYKNSDDDFMMWVRCVTSREGLNSLKGINYLCWWEIADDEFKIQIAYFYRDNTYPAYTETLPNFLRNMSEEYVKKAVTTAYRVLIKRSFNTEVNRIFGGDFYPL